MKYKNVKEAINGYGLASRYLGEARAYRNMANLLPKDSVNYTIVTMRMRMSARWAVSDGKWAFKFQKVVS